MVLNSEKMSKIISQFPNLTDIEKAAARIAPFAEQTPVRSSSGINEMFGAEIFFKCENDQKVGAFKFRGACNAVFSLSEEEAAKGVATHSSGNHGAALALAGKLRQIPVHVVMPNNTHQIKIENVAQYGANILLCEPTLNARESTLEELMDNTGAVLIHPYNDDRIICGQGTAARELLLDYPQLEIMMAPIGGGGLMSGTCIASNGLNPDITIIGAEPLGADDAFQSLAAGRIIPQTDPKTLADGLLTSLGDKTFPIIHEYVREIITVTETHIKEAMKIIYETLDMVIEPSSAVVLGALLEKNDPFKNKQIGMILTGGNVDIQDLPY